MAASPPHFARAAAWARRYVGLGLNPLPSRADAKRPALRRYAEYRDGVPIPERWLEPDRWWTPNIQVATGTAWRLAVVDLDGPAALIRWRGWLRTLGGAPSGDVATWTVRTGGDPGGLHLYFRIPEGIESCPTRRLWGIWDSSSADWSRHCFIELKADRGLVVAPPSAHSGTGVEYRFVPGRAPRDLGPPAPLPAWLLEMPGLRRPAPPAPPPARTRCAAPRRRGVGGRPYPAWRAVLDGISPAEKLDLARSWGLRIAGSSAPNAAGWVSCHALGREDRNPSASFHPASGYYTEPGQDAPRMNLFDLAVALGAYASWLDCLNDLGARIGM